MRTKTVLTTCATLLIAALTFGTPGTATAPHDVQLHVVDPTPVVPDADGKLAELFAEIGGSALSITVYNKCCGGASCLVTSCAMTCCGETSEPHCGCSITGSAECYCKSA